ncbi:hypothetical protein IDJ75_03730 [Mucilaginibacter rigui]|uniref:Uncharacterized protein n=1 Tax=Mucilaginibacter rigui TaxID=534635 RepID=A0ABR7X1J3_9SPHI|nr:hypothetical protein [Mucilaginibacter rigui]MBD1384376.1 hypothetical protein [Mucilaginibacter rigui]
MLQNRVNPLGDIIKTPERGKWLGNRGVIHNEDKKIVRPYKVKAWIICELAFRGRHREVMMPNRWTELFFFDEATAFSAGHRPCFQCRYKAHINFKEMWLKGNPAFGFDMKTPVADIDAIIHHERITAVKSKQTYVANLTAFPDGTFVILNNEAHLVKAGKLYKWSPAGYDKPIDFHAIEKIEVLTPRSIVNTFSAGYTPQMG